MDIKDILNRIADENDQDAFKVFFSHYHPKLMSFAILFVKSRHHAEDIVSDTLVKLLKNRQKTFKMEHFEGYLFLMIKNQALNFLKKNSNRMLTDESYFDHDHLTSEYVDPLQKILDAELRARIFEVTESLPPKRKMVYKLIKDEGLKYKEVAQLMDISVRTVENHLDAAVKNVKQAIEAYLSEKQSNTPIVKMKKILSISVTILFSLFLFA